MQNEIRLDTINVYSNSTPVTSNIVHFAYGVPNHFPSAYVGPISSGFALKSGLAADKQVESVVNRSGVQNSKGQIESFATIDRIETERNQGSEDAFFVAGALASQGQFVNNYERTPALSGGAFSPFKALAHYIGGSGGNLYVPLDKIGLNVQPFDIPAVKRLLESNPSPGSYNFFEQSFGYQTYKDSWVTGAYLGGILLQADGIINVNPDNTYSYNYMIRSSAPDYYDADAKPPGKRRLWRSGLQKY
ncbi:lipid II-degrading bacteriocin [Methylobacterium aquaticum]|uniref:lipid II-degrading bacteriocin n=1 Tax=Methylobacterium aquaticum TaxID=270351 RepID=UPI003D17D44B